MSNPYLPNQTRLSDEEREALVLKLRRKEGSWVEWGQACLSLQRSGGLSPNQLFEETGFEPTHQTQVTVAAQVYESILKLDAPSHVREHFGRTGSDVLYELRGLNQPQRLQTAQFALERNLDCDQIREIAKLYKEFGLEKRVPDEFQPHPGDAVAYYNWRQAKERSDLADRSRLIARGLQFAFSQGARGLLEKLLIESAAPPQKPQPLLPFYRPEQEEDLPRLVPHAGVHPLTAADLAVPAIASRHADSPFELTTVPAGNWLVLPGWQSLRRASSAVGFELPIQQLPGAPEDADEPVVVVCDRDRRDWDDSSFFVVEEGGALAVRWFPQQPGAELLARVILILRPKRILDEGNLDEPWQLEE